MPAAKLEPRFPKKCEICGAEFLSKYNHTKTCSQSCSWKLHDRSKKILNQHHCNVHIKPEVKVKRTTYKSPISDDEQLALNKRIDSRMRIGCSEVVHYRPGTPEFDRVCMELTSQGSA